MEIDKLKEPVVEIQSISDIYKLLDGNLINKLYEIISSIDTNKIKQIMDAIKINEDTIEINLNLKVKK